MNLKIVEHTVRIITIEVEARVDAFTAPDLRRRIEAVFADGVCHLVIDLSQVTFFDSAAMAVLVSALKQARQAGGDVKLVWPAAVPARRIFSLTKFDRVFDMADTPAAAVRAFGG